MKSIKKSVLAGLSALAIAGGLATPVANAQPLPPFLPFSPAPPAVEGVEPLQDFETGAELVVFGDSFVSNAGKQDPTIKLTPERHPLAFGCQTHIANWPKIMAKNYNKSLADWSCNGAGDMPFELKQYTELAIQNGDLGVDTKDVVLMYGGVDPTIRTDVASQLSSNEGLPTLSSTTGPSLFRDTVKSFADRVRQVAPNARITLVSYPEFLSGDKFCPLITPNPAGGESNKMEIVVPRGERIQLALRDNQANVANYAGMNFVDLYTPTKGHGTCAPDGQRWVNGLKDPEEGPQIMHPTDHGMVAFADIIGKKMFA
ncbi:GDSL-type esterase/lipase family protein [Corynebacterium uterequi]|uniref:GDSL-like Lipase/Acylhydrolase family n=1 Tax=Corynebacterium uterequi TaxID=1072256 RepID=A0A0G3HED1_9CORY|nr:GDSL-type esterase/lipase family protein [Corynebacterium uterequi]AKK11629.1 GDSL-like Lipase/Acylhydrolase family [Corynebacterium uterequi]